jgi:hypothetical protein
MERSDINPSLISQSGGCNSNSSCQTHLNDDDDQCASCNKRNVILKRCASCKVVKYCGVDCQTSHRREHKSLCRLFQTPPLYDHNCPICFLPMPLIGDGATYLDCCGQYICGGCLLQYLKLNVYESYCPFCRCRIPGYDVSRSTRDHFNNIAERVSKNDPVATFHVASVYANGDGEIVVKNYEVAFGLFKRAALLGHVTAHREMGNMLFLGRGIKEDVDLAKHHWEIAAKKGDYFARYSLAMEETNSIKRFRHLSISASQGHKESMELILRDYNAIGNEVMKNDINNTLRTHCDSVTRISSDERRNHKNELMKINKSATY